MNSGHHRWRARMSRSAYGLARKQAGHTTVSWFSLDRIEAAQAGRLNENIGSFGITPWRRSGSGAEPANCGDIGLDTLVREVAADADFEASGCNRAVRVLTLHNQ